MLTAFVVGRFVFFFFVFSHALARLESLFIARQIIFIDHGGLVHF